MTVVPTYRAFGTGGSIGVDRCQSCGSDGLEAVVFLGFLPPVNTMRPVGTRPEQEPWFPAQVLRCARCTLVQLGTIVDPAVLFPPTYAYTSGTTRILRENFAQLARRIASLGLLAQGDLVVDIGSNDGTLLSNFRDGHRVLGIEPTQAARLGSERGIPTWERFFDGSAASDVVAEHGRATLVTATNVFAHMEDIHGVIDAVLTMLDDDGSFVSESHYWLSLVETVQYDTIYHEHLRYYSLSSLRHLLAAHGLEVFMVERIPTHGGSIRAYAARKGRRSVDGSVQALVEVEEAALTAPRLAGFRERVVRSKLALMTLLDSIRRSGGRIYGVGAPSRATTLINYVGLDEGIIAAIAEVPTSHKIGKYVPGTLIPVVTENALFEDRPDHALMLSWHIADELCPKIRAAGFAGDFIIPLPEPRIVRGSEIDRGPARRL